MFMTTISQRPTMLNCSLLVVVSWVLYKYIRSLRNGSLTTKLRGPKLRSPVVGTLLALADDDCSVLYEQWGKEYGRVFQIPVALGSKATVILDSKAVAYFFSKDTLEFRRSDIERRGLKELLGEGLLYAEGEDHKRQRKALMPAFGASAIRDYAHVFFDSAHKVKIAWNATFETNVSDDIVVDIQYWMNRISMDSIGIAGFSHDFESLHGKSSAVIDLIESFAKYPMTGLGILKILLTPYLPVLRCFPSKRQQLTKNFKDTLIGISETILRRTGSENDIESLKKHEGADKSIIGILVQSENTSGQPGLSQREILEQMEVLIAAGYETTATSMTWAFIELCRHPEAQAKLRKELMQTQPEDPTYDQLIKNLPYLDAVMREVFRLYPPLWDITRVVHVDEIIPLAYPIETTSGQKVNSISLAKGERVIVPIKTLNTSQDIWGEDAKEFKPERWTDEESLSERARELPGYSHLLTFVDGTRMCIGRNFAIAEFKAALAILVKNFEFEFRDGSDNNSKIDIVRPILPRPKLRGEEEVAVPLRIRRIEAN